MNIFEVNIGDEVIDKQTKKVEKVLNKTTNSFLVTRTKVSEQGINCDQWFTEKDFKDKFKW